MLKKISNQKKVVLLPWISAVVFLLLYWLAFSETFKLRSESKSLEKEAIIMQSAPSEMVSLRKKLDEINKIAGEKAADTGIDPLMELVSRLSSTYHVTLSGYQPAHIFQYQNYTVETRTVNFDAPFIPCLKVLYDLEKNYPFGKVISVNYTVTEDRKTSKKYLSMQLLIQSIHNENNPENKNKDE